MHLLWLTVPGVGMGGGTVIGTIHENYPLPARSRHVKLEDRPRHVKLEDR